MSVEGSSLVEASQPSTYFPVMFALAWLLVVLALGSLIVFVVRKVVGRRNNDDTGTGSDTTKRSAGVSSES